MQNLIRSWHRPYFLAIFFGLVGISLLRKLFDPDVWFHMVVGREVIRRMGIPPYEFYILPRLGEPGEFHEWGFGVLYYLIRICRNGYRQFCHRLRNPVVLVFFRSR
jgi:hypothetical protein